MSLRCLPVTCLGVSILKWVNKSRQDLKHILLISQNLKVDILVNRNEMPSLIFCEKKYEE